MTIRSSGPKNVLAAWLLWINARIPVSVWWRRHFTEYYVAKNLDAWYLFGALAGVVLGIEFVTGVLLSMHYQPVAELNASGVPVAFASIEKIMCSVPWGWLIRTVHAAGATALFVILYLHIFCSLLYGSYRKPRELVWLFGLALLLVSMAEAFFGGLLPWGRLSYWASRVLVNLFSGSANADVGSMALTRFYSLHIVVIPLILLGLVLVHILSSRSIGLNNPDGIDIQRYKDGHGKPLDGLPFHPYFTTKDMVGIVVFLMILFAVVFFAPTGGGLILDAQNFHPADPLRTPEQIRPAWYLAPYYSILRSVVWDFFGIEARFWSVAALAGSVLLLALLPWLDGSPVRSMRYRGKLSRILLGGWTLAFMALGCLGTLPLSSSVLMLSQVCTLYYFFFFLSMPVWSRLDRCDLPPERVVMK